MDHPTSSVSSINTSDALLEEPKKYSDFVRVAALALGIPIIIFGFLGNMMTIIGMIKTKSLRTGGNIFIISLSVFDLMYVSTNNYQHNLVQWMDASAKYTATYIL